MTWENIDNKAEYKASGKGISYSTGAGVPLNALGLLSNMGPTVKDKEGTTTQSAVSQGTITITNKENQTQDIEKLNRNTEDSLNKLKEIFDKTKVEEKQELIHMMNIVGNQIIHEAADHYGWKEGSTEKLLLHGAIGALTGTMSGGNALSGAVSGSVNEFALAYLSATKFKACLIRRAFLFISNGKLCFYIYHFIPFTVWIIFVAISPFISPVMIPDISRTGLYHRNAGVFNRRAEIRSCARLCVTPPRMLIPTGEKEFLR